MSLVGSGGETWQAVALGKAGVPGQTGVGSMEELASQGFRYPAERAAVADIQALIGSQNEGTGWSGTDAIEWGLETGALTPGEVDCAEVSPTLRCTEDCPGCPDAISVVMDAIRSGLMPRQEVKATPELMLDRVKLLRELGVQHVMNIGGTIDRVKSLTNLIKFELAQGLVVSWFTDCIPQIDESGQPTDLLQENLADGWIQEVATHVSTDYPFEGDLFADELSLPPKSGRKGVFAEDPEYSRVYKSQYGAVGARRLIEAGVRRVVVNMTISHANVDKISALYDQAVALQTHAENIGSPTEVLFTFSPWVWRAHQARGDNPADHSPDAALQLEDMPVASKALLTVLEDTYNRISDGRPRILANSSGYTLLHTNPESALTAVEQDVAYPDGRPLMLNVNPDGSTTLDPMFKGPELNVLRSTFGYMDRTPKPDRNPFVRFHHLPTHPYLPNLISLPARTVKEAQPIPLSAA